MRRWQRWRRAPPPVPPGAGPALPSIARAFTRSFALPSAVNLRDAILVVLKTQELAGIDVVADGELSRFDIGHPETNGMIDYFVRPLDGVRTTLTRPELEEFRHQSHMGFRARPAGIVHGKLGEGTLDLPAATALAAHPLPPAG